LPMEIVIKELNESIVRDIHRVDNEFEIVSKLVLHLKDGRLSYTTVSIPPKKKRYPPDDYDYTPYVNNPEKTAFLAYIEGQVAGELILHRHWNKFAWVEGIGVDKSYRRRGIGRALVKRGEEWARKHGLPGIMLETQDNNVGACRFYESCGFVLTGFDSSLYKASPCNDEIALFWYLMLDTAVSIKLD
jgi:streptothricin acetyltransferase